jgi:hypothetical protein
MFKGGAQVASQVIKLELDTAPLRSFLDDLKLCIESSQQVFDLGELDFELVRVEQDISTAGAGKLLMVCYPSDALVNFVAARFASDGELKVI